MNNSPTNNQALDTREAADIEIIDSENRPLVKINRTEGCWDDLIPCETNDEIDSTGISQYNHWISSLPAAATAVAGNSPQLLTCSFEFSQLVQASDGKGALGIVRSSGSTQIGAHARFQEAENLKSMVNANLIFNLASQVLAQKHLADINERLRAIEQKVDALQKHLEIARFAPIQALHEHLLIIGRLLAAKEEITKETSQNLAKSAQEARAQVIHIKKDIDTTYADIEKFDASSWLGSNDLREQLIQKIDKAKNFQREYLLGMQCLLMANLILFIKHGGNKEFALTSELYLEELNDANGAISRWEKAKRTVALHLKKMKPLFERTVSSQANALQVNRKLEQADKLLLSDTVQITQLNNRIQTAQSPRVMLEVVNGKVLRGRYLSEPTHDSDIAV